MSTVIGRHFDFFLFGSKCDLIMLFLVFLSCFIPHSLTFVELKPSRACTPVQNVQFVATRLDCVLESGTKYVFRGDDFPDVEKIVN